MGTNLFEDTLETLGSGTVGAVKQAGQGAVQQAGGFGKATGTQVLGNIVSQPQQQSSEGMSQQDPNSPTNPADDVAKDEMMKALYGSSQPQNGQQQSSTQLQGQASVEEQQKLAHARKLLQEQHNKVYFDKLMHPEQGKKEENVQERLEKEEQEKKQKEQMKMQEEEKKNQIVKAPSKESAERERKLGG